MDDKPTNEQDDKRQLIESLSKKTKGLKLLIVEDEEILLKTYKSFMGRYFDTMELVQNGIEGLEAYERLKPDIIVTDIVMPRMDGLEMSAKIRAQDKDVQIIVSTAYLDTQMMQRAIESGIDHYVTKPIRMRFFLSIIEKSVNAILRTREAQNEIRRLTELLTAIKTINELVVQLDDRDTLLKSICEELVKRELYASVWIALVDEGHHITWSHAEGKDAEAFRQALNNGVQEMNLDCIQSVNNSNGEFCIVKENRDRCGICSLLPYGVDNNALIFSLKFQNRHYGYLNISVRDKIKESGDEFDLLLDVANDVAYALHKYKLEAEAKKNEKLMLHQSRLAAMGEMMSMIAHQWRQPITTIGMSANNVILEFEMGQVEKTEVVGHLQSILDQVTYLSQTIDDFRSFFDPNRKKQWVTIGKVVNEAKKILNKSLEANNVSLRIEQEVDDKVFIYENELVQTLLNIVKNAKDELVARVKEGREIRVWSSVGEKNAVIRIEDNAGGIPEENLYRIFEPYFSTKGENGTGLGLYMSDVIISKHFHGMIKAENTPRGALFTITFPKAGVGSSTP